MTEERFEKTATGTVDPESVEKLKKAPDGVKVPAVSLGQTAWTLSLPIPEVKPISNDRQDKRAARELQRELAIIAGQTAKTGLAIQSVRAVLTHVVYNVDQGQEQMMNILYSRTRHEGMNELVAAVISQSLQSMVAQMMALAESHYKRLMERV